MKRAICVILSIIMLMMCLPVSSADGNSEDLQKRIEELEAELKAKDEKIELLESLLNELLTSRQTEEMVSAGTSTPAVEATAPENG